MLVLVLQGSGNETLEQRVSAVRAALELGVELGAQVEVPARNLHSFYQAAVGAGAGNDQALLLELGAELVEYLDYYNNRRIKAKLKGLPPAIHRQQALSAA